jgi:hypothetical protein
VRVALGRTKSSSEMPPSSAFGTFSRQREKGMRIC